MRWIVLLLLLSSVAHAAPRSVAGEPEGKPGIDLSAVQQQQTFVETERDGVTVRVGMVVIDYGGSTDVSPKAGLFLTMFGESEMKGSSSVHYLGPLNELISAKRVEAGIYEFVLKRYDYDQALGGGMEPTVKLRVDARMASVAVRAMKGVDELDTGRIVEPVTVDESLVK